MMLEVKDGVERGGSWIKNEASALGQNLLEAKGVGEGNMGSVVIYQSKISTSGEEGQFHLVLVKSAEGL